ncbi:hypothetical protein LFYK43_03340 [Ligilactobacillus salitolerans]|uniref:Transcobalamin-like C-terminal domain-containing protein n=1 Tax=Ligilactobacillus salitolerans TaxID=1808352 RepID=A0A401IQT9_9LACO|nr:DUF4430 domain-containing protein [Ligilactobacillus salitolerans]GBG93875.1 hypothetical protein LFYK43_03340 [Ligilactobacillus salitolerans]
MLKRKTLPVLLMSVFLLTGCSTQANSDHKSAKPSSVTVTYRLKNGHKTLGTKKVHVKKGAKVITGLRKAWPVKVKKGIVTAIDGRQQNEKQNKYWMYTVNGKSAKKGVEQQKVSDQGHVVFTLQKTQQ